MLRTVWVTGLGIALAAAAAMLAQDAARNPLAGNPAAVAAGRQLFAQTCEVCHGQNAAGGRAPALAGRTFSHGSADSDLFQNIRVGIAGTQMPGFGSLASDEVWQLVSYIRSLSGAAAPSVSETVAGDAAAGEALFFGDAGCAACHQVNARGGVVGPDLSNAGRLAADLLRRKLLDPQTSTAQGGRGGRGGAPGSVVATLRDGRTIRGIRRAEDSFTLLMTDTSGALRRIDKSEAASIENQTASLMPAVTRPAAEVDNLVAYLKSLHGRDLAQTIRAELPGGLAAERLANAAAEPRNWLTYWGDYQGRHYSALNQITAANVRGLQAKWAVQMAGDSVLESTPIVVDGVMYTSGMPGEVRALDAQTGLQIWRYQRRQKVVNPNEINRFSRGVAVLGNRVFLGTLDAALVALDARTGQLLWETQVADTMQGYSLTSPPLALKDKIVTGIAGGEFGIRGFVDAYDPRTGARLWRFYTIPAPGEPGSETWKGQSWRYGGGATWLTGSYDPELDTLYWAVGNPGPDWDWQIREGDNLYSCSVVALDASTGKLKWHYQFTPGDSHDWDSTEDMILVDRAWHGRQRKLLLHADRNGMFYVLDRETGEFLRGSAFVRQTWNEGFDDRGRPKVVAASRASREGSTVYPSVVGGTNFQAPSYSPATGWYYVAAIDFGQRYLLAPEMYEAGVQYRGGGAQGIGEPATGAIKAIDPETGEVKWEFPVSRMSFTAGVLATAGNVVFAATAEGNLLALDARSGELLWRFQTGASISASPMSYAVDGRQFVAISAGNVLYSFGLPE